MNNLDKVLNDLQKESLTDSAIRLDTGKVEGYDNSEDRGE